LYTIELRVCHAFNFGLWRDTESEVLLIWISIHWPITGEVEYLFSF